MMSCCLSAELLSHKSRWDESLKSIRDEAAKNGHVKCYINSFKTLGDMALHAAEIGNLSALQFAYEYKFLREAVHEKFLHMCNISIHDNQLDCLRFLVTLPYAIKKTSTFNEFDPVYVALRARSLESLEILIAAGFEIKEGDYGHMWAADVLRLDSKCLDYLISLGYKSAHSITIKRSFELEVREKETCCKICMSEDVPTYECMSCNETACGDCIVAYFKGKELKCMHCGEQYSYLNVQDLPIDATEYKTMRVNKLFDDMHLPKRKDIRENNKKINDLIKLHGAKSPIVFQQRLKLFNIVDSCKRVSCTGRHVDGVCNICNCKECDNCGEYLVSNHDCNPDFVATYTLLKQDTKPCPKCNIRISKTEGCNDMFCTNCKAKFSWRTGEFRADGHNPHQAEYEATLVNANAHTNANAHVNPMIRLRERLRDVNEKLEAIPSYAQFPIRDLIDKIAELDAMFKFNIGVVNDTEEVATVDMLRNRYIANYIGFPQFKKNMMQYELFNEFFEMRIKLVIPILERIVGVAELVPVDYLKNWQFPKKGYLDAIERDCAMFQTIHQRLINVYGIKMDFGGRAYCPEFMEAHSHDRILNEIV